MMSSSVISEDMILEVLSYLPASEMGKARVLNKECNKRTYESWFLNLHRHRSMSISGYFLQYYEGGNIQTSFVHDQGREFKKNGVSIEFLPPGKVKIEACDASHGILFCIIETGLSVPEFIVCKPTTKQYQIIPKPIMLNRRTLCGLTVIGVDPFRYKILRLTNSRSMIRNLRTFVCEVFDSDSFTWKKIKNVRLPRADGIILSEPVQAYGFMHWLSRNNNVIRFCPKTEIWCKFPLPKFGYSPTLVHYEGKLGVVRCWMAEDQKVIHRLWVLKSSSQKSWKKVKDIKSMEVRRNVKWTTSNDVVMLSSPDRVCFYNINTEKVIITKELRNDFCFPFFSDYEMVDLKSERRHITTYIVVCFPFFLLFIAFLYVCVQ